MNLSPILTSLIQQNNLHGEGDVVGLVLSDDYSNGHFAVKQGPFSARKLVPFIFEIESEEITIIFPSETVLIKLNQKQSKN